MTLAPVQAPDAPDTGKTLTGYAVVPHAVARDSRLSVQARLLYVLLDGYAGASGRCWPSEAQLAEDLGKDERTVRRYLVELQELHLIRRQQTRSTTVTWVANGSRLEMSKRSGMSAGEDTAVRRERTPVSSGRTTEKINNNNSQPPAAEPVQAPAARAAAAVVQEYLDAIHQRTGHRIAANPEASALVQKIAAKMPPAEAGLAVELWLTARRPSMHNPGGFLLRVVLPGIAAGDDPAPPTAVQPVYVPPAYVPEPVQSGDAVAGLANARAALAQALAGQEVTR